MTTIKGSTNSEGLFTRTSTYATNVITPKLLCYNSDNQLVRDLADVEVIKVRWEDTQKISYDALNPKRGTYVYLTVPPTEKLTNNKSCTCICDKQLYQCPNDNSCPIIAYPEPTESKPDGCFHCVECENPKEDCTCVELPLKADAQPVKEVEKCTNLYCENGNVQIGDGIWQKCNVCGGNNEPKSYILGLNNKKYPIAKPINNNGLKRYIIELVLNLAIPDDDCMLSDFLHALQYGINKHAAQFATEAVKHNNLVDVEGDAWRKVSEIMPPFDTLILLRGVISWKSKNSVSYFSDIVNNDYEILEYGQSGYLLQNNSDYLVVNHPTPEEVCSEYITHWMPIVEPVSF